MTEPSRDPRSAAPLDEADVRALLGDLGSGLREPWTRGPEPAPDDVVARLDAALAGLAATEAPVAVVPLRRRRPVGRLLLRVAAAVVLGGVAAGSLVPGLLAGSDEMTAESADAGPAAESEAESQAGAGVDERGDDRAELADPFATLDQGPDASAYGVRGVRVSPDRVARDVRRSGLLLLADAAALRVADGCGAGPAEVRDRATRAVEVRAAGGAAYVLALPAGGAVEVVLVRCGDDAVLGRGLVPGLR